MINIFARPSYIGNRFHRWSPVVQTQRLSSRIRGEEMAEFLKDEARLNPEKTSKGDINIYVKPENIDIEIFSSYESETKTWIEIFRIEERYKATLSSESEGLEWLAEILDDVKNKEDLTKDDALKTIKKSFERNPFAQQRFLKVPFLEACQNAGIIS